jgi:hypothetical protein
MKKNKPKRVTKALFKIRCELELSTRITMYHAEDFLCNQNIPDVFTIEENKLDATVRAVLKKTRVLYS